MMHRKDTNHDDIREAGELFGFVMIDNSQRGPLDFFAYKPRQRHIWCFIEVKFGKYWHLTRPEADFILAHPESCRIVENALDIQSMSFGKLPMEPTLRAARDYFRRLK